MDPFDAIAAALARFPGARFDDGYYGIRFDGPTPRRRLDAKAFIAEYDARLRALPTVLVFAQSSELAARVPAGTHVASRRVYYSTDPQSPWDEAIQEAAIVAGDSLDVRGFCLPWRGSGMPVVIFHPDEAIALGLLPDPVLLGAS